jgi:rod shape-determining protein MreB and related proteins
MRIPIIDKLNRRIGIDLGSANTRIWVESRGVVLDEPTCLAFDKKTRDVLAVGDEAAQMDGRVSKNIEVVYPMSGSEVYDDVAVRALLKMFLEKSVGSITLLNPIIMVSISTRATQADREIITEILSSLGAGEIYTITQPLAASIGSGVPIADASGSFLLHLGDGVVEGVVISLGSTIISRSSGFSGNYLSESLQFFCQKELGLKISKKTAKILKEEVVSLNPQQQIEKLIAGQDNTTENPKEMLVTSRDLLDHMADFAKNIEDLLTELLSKMPSELATDVIDKGMLLSGGLASIDGLDRHLTQKLGVPVSVVDDPLTVVISGIGTALEHLDLFKKSLGYQG